MLPDDNCFPSSCRDPDGLEVGTEVGSWRVERELGRGGMGTVYAVRHVEIGKCAALKVVHREMLSGTYDADAFLTEARAVNAFSHPNVVDIFEAGTLPDGRPFILMERLRGRTLGDRHAESRVPALEVIDYLIPLCDALTAAHAAGIVHRDIKLDNVFLAEGKGAGFGGRGVTVKLLDWGVASIADAGGASPDALTIGTPRYVAPEQVRGEGVTSAADIYALGVMAYELFLEEPPFNATTTAELLLAHVNDPPPVPHEVWPRIPVALEELLLAMLRKRPSERPTAARVGAVLAEVRDALRARQSVAVMPPRARTHGRDTAREVGSEPTMPLSLLGRARPWKWLAAAALVAGIFGAREVVRGRHAAVPTAAAEELPERVPVAATPVRAPDDVALSLPDAGDPIVPATVRPRAERAPVVEARWVTRHAAVSTVSTPRASTSPARQRPATRLHPDSLVEPY